jgi:hypothetical protein
LIVNAKLHHAAALALAIAGFATGMTSCSLLGPSEFTEAMCGEYRSTARLRDSGVTKEQRQAFLDEHNVTEMQFVGVPSVEDYVYNEHPELTPDQLYESCIKSPTLPGQI